MTELEVVVAGVEDQVGFGFVGLVWNSIMSWAGGWFFLYAAEIFTVGNKNFELVGLGSYISVAGNEGNIHALVIGIITLIVIIVLLDQFLTTNPRPGCSTWVVHVLG